MLDFHFFFTYQPLISGTAKAYLDATTRLPSPRRSVDGTTIYDFFSQLATSSMPLFAVLSLVAGADLL